MVSLLINLLYMAWIKYIKLVLLNAVSTGIHKDTHFGATKNVLLEATYRYLSEVRDTKNWPEQHF